LILWSEISWNYQLDGCGYVNNAEQDNPTFEFFPPNGPPIVLKILSTTLPANLFPLTWLLPSGRLVLQSNWATSLLNYTGHEEIPLDDIPDAVRVYPALLCFLSEPLTIRPPLFCSVVDRMSSLKGVCHDFLPLLHIDDFSV